MICIKCQKNKNEVFGLAPIANETFICSECITSLYNMLPDDSKPQSAKRTKPTNTNTIPTVSDIISHLNRYIIGQQKVKETLAIAIRNHLKVSSMDAEEAKGMEKSNILLIGETGTGKTAILKRLAEAANIDCMMVDANSLTASGYTGRDVSGIIQELYDYCDRDIERTQRAIIVIDEIDKKKRKPQDQNKDLGGEEVQKELLKIMEGTTVKLSNGKYSIDTTNILFICSGAFVGIQQIKDKRVGTKGSMGFGAKRVINTTTETISDDVIEFGLIPEFVGRLPVIAHTDPLTESDLMRITKDTDNNIYKQFQCLFQADGIELQINDDVFEGLVSKCFKDKIGVRGIRKEMEGLLHTPQKEIEDYHKKGIKRIVVSLNSNKEIQIRKHKR